MGDEEFIKRALAAGYSQQEVDDYLAKSKPAGPPPNTDINPRNLARAAVQGATFNFGDEILGKLPTWLGGGKQAEEEMRANEKAFKKAHPYVSAGAEIAGGLAVPGLGAVKTLGTGARTIRGAVAAGSALGGISGGLAGAGAAEGDLSNRLGAAAMPAAAGALLGGALPGAAAFLKSAASPATRANTRLSANIQRSGGVQKLIDKAQEFQAAGKGNDVMLADLSVPMRQAADFAANNSETAAEQIGKSAYGRHADQSERILNDTRNVVGDPQAPQIVSDLEQSTARWAGGPKGYEGLRQNNPVIIPQDAQKFGAFLNSPKVKQAWEEAKDIQLIGPQPPSGPISFDVLQSVKTRLNTAKEGAFNKGLTDLGGRLKGAHDELVKEMEKSVPGYKAISAEYHGRKGLERAVEAGQAAFRQTDSRGLQQQVSQLGSGELQKFREGMASEMLTKLRSTGTNRDIAKTLVDASPATKDKLEIVFGGSKPAEDFMHKMNLEREMAKLMKTLQGSETAKRLAAREGIDPLELGLDIATIPAAPWSAMSRLAGVFRKGTGGFVSKKTAGRLGPILTTKGSQNIENLLRQWKLNPPLVGAGMGRFAPLAAGRGASLLLGDEENY